MNAKRKFNSYSYGLRVALLVTLFIVCSCRGKLGKTGAVDLSSSPVQTVEDMFVVQTENGLLKMRMEADLMERYDEDSLTFEVFPEGFSVFAYTDEGLLETLVVSDQARHSTHKDGTEIWMAIGNVVVKNLLKEETMETDTLYWDRPNERMYTDCYVQMYSPDGYMQGYGMESDQRARESIIKRPFSSYGFVTQDTTVVKIDSVNFIGPLLKK